MEEPGGNSHLLMSWPWKSLSVSPTSVTGSHWEKICGWESTTCHSSSRQSAHWALQMWTQWCVGCWQPFLHRSRPASPHRLSAQCSVLAPDLHFRFPPDNSIQVLSQLSGSPNWLLACLPAQQTATLRPCSHPSPVTQVGFQVSILTPSFPSSLPRQSTFPRAWCLK